MAETVHYRAKSLFASKTLIFNVLSAVVTVLASDELKDVLGPQALTYVTTAITIINIVLRVYSVRPVAMVRPGRTKSVPVQKLAA